MLGIDFSCLDRIDLVLENLCRFLRGFCRDGRGRAKNQDPGERHDNRDGDANSTDASFWRILFCPAGPGHVLYLKSELTDGRWRIYSDNIAMARWLQKTVQGMLNAELKDLTIPVTDAAFSKSGDAAWGAQAARPKFGC